jgi:membrane protein YdbS with pleckstrin-like domain
MNCRQCGVDVVEDAVFCHVCGADLRLATHQQDHELAGDAAPARAPGAALREKSRQAAGEIGRTERELWQGGFSPKAMAGKAVAAAVATIVAMGAAMAVGEAVAWWIALSVIAVGWLYLVGELAYRRLSVHYRATDQILFHESGILWRTTDRVELIDMDDISFRQGIIDRMFGVGTVKISSSDVSHPVLELVGIDDVREVAARLDHARRDERMRRGLHIESV